MIKWSNSPLLPNHLLVSNDGQIKDTIKGRIISLGKSRQYRSIAVKVGSKVKTTYVHRCVLSAFAPVDGWEKLYVNHIDFDPSNNNIDNLEWCTPKENMQHSKKHNRFVHSAAVASENSKTMLKEGRHPFQTMTQEQHRAKYKNRKGGFNAHNVKMTPEKLAFIKQLLAEGKHPEDIYPIAGICRTAVYKIRAGTINYNT